MLEISVGSPHFGPVDLLLQIVVGGSRCLDTFLSQNGTDVPFYEDFLMLGG